MEDQQPVAGALTETDDQDAPAESAVDAEAVEERNTNRSPLPDKRRPGCPSFQSMGSERPGDRFVDVVAVKSSPMMLQKANPSVPPTT